MKLLETPLLAQIGDALTGVHGESLLACRLESYSCKMAGTDKRWCAAHRRSAPVSLRRYKQISAEGDIDEMEALAPSWTDKARAMHAC